MKLLLTSLFTLLACSTFAEDRKSQTNVPYGEHAKQKLDIYWNTKFKNAPILINIHGGGWQNGDKKGFGSPANQAFFVGELGCVLVCPNYRLLGDLIDGKVTKETRRKSAGQVDAMMSDVASAVAFVQRNAAKYGGDPKRIIVCGSSAGAHLSAALAYCNSRDWLKGTKYEGDHLNIIGWYGDSAPLDKTLNPQIPFLNDGIPILNVDKADPPGFMIVGTDDRLVPIENSTKFQKSLTESGIWSQILVCKGGKHVVGKFVVSNQEMKKPFTAFVNFVTGKSKAPSSEKMIEISNPTRR